VDFSIDSQEYQNNKHDAPARSQANASSSFHLPVDGQGKSCRQYGS
jgi:hypothetical protein